MSLTGVRDEGRAILCATIGIARSRRAASRRYANEEGSCSDTDGIEGEGKEENTTEGSTDMDRGDVEE